MKRIVYIIVLILMINIVSGVICEDRKLVSQNCTMLSPHLICGAYSYDVYNVSGDICQTGTLISLNQSIYYFNLTVGAGDYIIKLCDNSTREIRVTNEEETMSFSIGIILSILGMIGFLSYLMYYIGKDNDILKILYFSGALFFGWILLGLTNSIAEFYSASDNIKNILGIAYWTFLMISIAVIFYLVIAYIYNLLMVFQTKKNDPRLQHPNFKM